VTEAPSELLIFRVDHRIYCAAVSDVRRIGPTRSGVGEAMVCSSLGQACARRRGIVVDCGDAGERTLVVDEVLGVRRVPAADLRPVPAFAAACLHAGTVAGFAMLGEEPTILIDLRALVGGADTSLAGVADT
jgi:chemotaxis signal transduction protein